MGETSKASFKHICIFRHVENPYSMGGLTHQFASGNSYPYGIVVFYASALVYFYTFYGILWMCLDSMGEAQDPLAVLAIPTFLQGLCTFGQPGSRDGNLKQAVCFRLENDTITKNAQQ